MNLDDALKIEAAVDRYSELSDGAFWAALEDEGIYPEDVDEAYEVIEKYE